MNRENLKDYSLSTNMSYDYHSAISLFNTKLNLQRQRLHQIIRCILFFNEQIKLQKQIINSYEKGNDDSNGNIYKRKNKANNNINKYVQIDYSKEYEKKENQLKNQNDSTIKDTISKLEENKINVINDCLFIQNNLRESKDFCLLESQSINNDYISKEQSNSIYRMIKNNLKRYIDIKSYIYINYYKGYLDTKNKSRTIENNNKINANKKIKLNHFSSMNKSNSSRNDKYLSIRANSIYISNDNQNKKVPNRNNKGKEALIKLFRK